MKNATPRSSILGGSASVSRNAATTFLNQLVRPGLLILLACFCLSAAAQTREWAWMGGSDTVTCYSLGNCGQPGVYGAKGTPAATNVPGGRYTASSWTDSGGHLWLFGGDGFDSAGNEGFLNDLWEFNPSLGATGEWAWMGGSSTADHAGVYGPLGTFGAGNTPGGRLGAASWTDSGGHLWLFGGYGNSSKVGGFGDFLNDLWEFDPSVGATGEWAWMGGSSTAGSNGGQPGVYGVLGKPAAGNIPGSRSGASSWTDGNGHLWLFGGYGFGANSNYGAGELNDLWEFDPTTQWWAWMGGSNTFDQPGVYGAKGTPAATNVPGGRDSANSWTDSSGHLWLFGGSGYDPSSSAGVNLNDLWEFNPSVGATGEWAWMGGSSTGNYAATYGVLGKPAAGNIPGSRSGASSWTDSSDNFWLFGGGGYDANGHYCYLNDLWEFDPSLGVTGEWAWTGGSNTGSRAGSYGVLGKPASGNVPGSRYSAASWNDGSGNFWIFGGDGYGASGGGDLNDLWEYLPHAATPAITWGNLVPITYGTALSGTQLNATATFGGSPVAGSYAYSPAAGTVLDFGWQTLSVTFTPANPAEYSTVTATATLLVNKAKLTVTAYHAGRAYGAANPAFNAVITGFVPGDTAATATKGVASLTTLANTSSPVGTYSISAAKGSLTAANYTFKFVNGTLTVAKAALTVTANSLSMTHGKAVPALTYTMTGFENGDTQAKATTGAPKVTTMATPISPGGTYLVTITQGSLAASNYSFLFKNGTLTIKYLGTTATPVFHPVAGTYTSAQTVTVTDATSGAIVHYTTNGANPLTSSPKFPASLTVSSATVTIKAIAVALGYHPSAVALAKYTITHPPTVISTLPANGAINVPVSQVLTATFSEAMKCATLASPATTFTLTGPGTTPATGTVSCSGFVAKFSPSPNLAYNTLYTATITTAATAAAGGALAHTYIWTFKTGPAPIPPPTVISTIPLNLAINVPVSQALTATFSEAMNPATIISAFKLTGPGTTPVGGLVSNKAAGFAATFSPTGSLAYNTLYTATITTAATAAAGGALAHTYVWTFTTGPAPIPPPVVLGPAISLFAGFGGGAGMSNQGILTVVNGDIGTTGPSTLITGFYDKSIPAVSSGYPCSYAVTPIDMGLVNGTIDTAPPPPSLACPNEGTAATMAIATQALAQAQTAYNTLQSLPGGITLASNELGNLKPAPGVYKSASFYDITAGPLTLDAGGNPNAYWIFQIGSNLSVGTPLASESVILANGAQAKNVFWQVGSAATINPMGGGTMVGTIISQAGISVAAPGATTVTTINGRALSLNASVTMVNTVLTAP
jgi:hypothetical protein